MLADMPTAGTSQILGFTESFEAITSNIYTRKTLAGTFIVINKNLVKDLKNLGIWDSSIKNQIINHDGSIQQIQSIPPNIQSLYKTVYEINQRHIINMSSDRTKYICQSQSLNIFLDSPSPTKISNMLIYGWKSLLKTGLYYLRTQVKSKPTKFTQEVKKYTCTDDICTSCSS
jgi:ribonucleoside-diphosphate reductase alpha chain